MLFGMTTLALNTRSAHYIIDPTSVGVMFITQKKEGENMGTSITPGNIWLRGYINFTVILRISHGFYHQSPAGGEFCGAL